MEWLDRFSPGRVVVSDRASTFVQQLLAPLSRCILEAFVLWEPSLGVWQRVPLWPSFWSRAGEPRPFHPKPDLTPSCLGSQEASAQNLTAHSEARTKSGPGRAIRNKDGFASFSGPREPLLSGPQPREMRFGLKGAVISFTVSSVGASCISPSTAKALDPCFPGSPGASLRELRADSSRKEHPSGGVTWAWLPPLPDPFFIPPSRKRAECRFVSHPRLPRFTSEAACCSAL